ncbi:PREDICTED: ABI gene family member 3 [Pseudopodoces humilis]|uniref:ABI gene family member 3 n=1 Tax=Pseudopodoces humilis TaxID=181119 RepID=UPI0006B6EE41|nr:PREDICTED: ABI gene family member 3 [Pseudopodoces humilis]
MSELERLQQSELPAGRQRLREQHGNLLRVAEYCHSGYLQAGDKRKALEETMALSTQALASVTSQLSSLATAFLRLLELQAARLRRLEADITCVAQRVDIHKEKVSRREIGALTVSKRLPSCPKIAAPPSPPVLEPYHRRPLSFSALDGVGHGVKDTSTQLSRTGTLARKSTKSSSAQAAGAPGRSSRVPEPVQPPVVPEGKLRAASPSPALSLSSSGAPGEGIPAPPPLPGTSPQAPSPPGPPPPAAAIPPPPPLPGDLRTPPGDLRTPPGDLPPPAPDDLEPPPPPSALPDFGDLALPPPPAAEDPLWAPESYLEKGTEHPKPLEKGTEHPKPLEKGTEHPKPLEKGTEHPKPLEKGTEHPKPLEKGTEHPKPLEKGTEHPKPLEKGSEHPKALEKGRSLPKPLDLAAGMESSPGVALRGGRRTPSCPRRRAPFVTRRLLRGLLEPGSGFFPGNFVDPV